MLQLNRDPSYRIRLTWQGRTVVSIEITNEEAYHHLMNLLSDRLVGTKGGSRGYVTSAEMGTQTFPGLATIIYVFDRVELIED